MVTPRYDRRALMRLIRELDSHDGLSVMSVRQADLTGLWAEAPDVVQRWLAWVARDAVQGRYPDLGVFPGLGVTAETPADDFRWKILRWAREQFIELSSLGLGILGAQPDATSGRVAAVQVITDGSLPHVRVNGAICGILWGWARPEALNIGLELPAVERDRAAHVTVFIGHSGGKPACFVFWSVLPSMIRADSPEGLVRKMTNSIAVPGARSRWAALKTRIDPEDIRSALFEAGRDGVPPEEYGTYMLDIIERIHEDGLPSRKSGKKVWTESELRPSAADEGQSIFDLLPADADVDSPVEDEVVRSIEASMADGRLSALAAVADADEMALLKALEDGWRTDSSRSVAEIARDRGWQPQDAEAVLKRLKRKAAKLKKQA